MSIQSLTDSVFPSHLFSWPFFRLFASCLMPLIA
nr:MAG TPA: hypothetical protein [Caudoviricetes sp.]